MVGLGRLERPTSPLSGVRSNHLSYRPELSQESRRAIYSLGRRPDHALSGEERETKTAASRMKRPDWPHVFLQRSDMAGWMPVMRDRP
jgi:hypothetical protein